VNRYIKSTNQTQSNVTTLVVLQL